MGYFRLLLIGALGFAFSVVAMASDIEEETPHRLMSDTVKKAIKLLPDKNLREALSDYFQVINPDSYSGESVGKENVGLAEFFSAQFTQNQCFQTAAINFYKDVATTLKKKNKCAHEPAAPSASMSSLDDSCMGPHCPGMSAQLSDEKLIDTTYGCATQRPSLSDLAGQGNKAYLKESWLMDLAMKHSKGHPLTALQLIGLCGHDDASQGIFEYFDDSEAAKNRITQEVKALKVKKNKTALKIKKLSKSTQADPEEIKDLGRDLNFINQQIQDLSASKGSTEYLTCPPKEADFYLPGSLSSKADITPELKKKIKIIQGPDWGHKAIPAKYYHVYKAAYLGCRMAERGVSPEKVKVIQSQVARIYRGLRMCESSKNLLQARKDLGKILGLKNLEDTDEVQKKITELWNNKIKNRIHCGEKSVYWGRTNLQKNEQICLALHAFDIAELDPQEKPLIPKRIQNTLKKYDAAYLYGQWYFGGSEVAGKTLTPCTDFRWKGPKDLMDPTASISGKYTQPKGWTDERYQLASQKLATWDVDFEWTIAQHAAGGEFGAEICGKTKENPFEAPQCREGTSSKKRPTSPGAATSGAK